VVPEFIQLNAKPRNRGWKTQERLLERNWKSLFDKPIDEIRRPDVVRVLDRIMAGGCPGIANNALAVLKKLMNWCLDRGMIDLNPINGLKPPRKPVARDRVLTDEELTRLWSVAEDQGYPFGPLVQMLMLTGQRRNEVSEMQWSEIDFARATWTIPADRAKNGMAHDVPLSEPVLNILSTLPRFAASDLVFTTTGTSPVSGLGKAKKRFEDAVGTQGWWLHDLRRTAASGMARAGVPPHVIEKVLNHKSGIISGVAAVYNRYSYADEKREALERWAEVLMRTTSSATNVCKRSPLSSESSETLSAPPHSAMT
jgi:integrase